MNENQSAAFVQAAAARATIRAMGMAAENMQRKHLGRAMAYGMDDFDAIIVDEAIGYNVAESHDLHTCSGCGIMYMRTNRKPRGGSRNFCLECAKSNIPSRLRQRDKRERLKTRNKWEQAIKEYEA